MRGPSNFEVIERPSNESHGIYATLDEARGCVAFDKLKDYEIWQGDHIVQENGPDWCSRCHAPLGASQYTPVGACAPTFCSWECYMDGRES